MYAAWAGHEPGTISECAASSPGCCTRWCGRRGWRNPLSQYASRIAGITKDDSREHHDTYSVEELASLAGLSPSHFRLIFKRVTGLTVTAYQQHAKVAKAVEYLVSGEYNVTETAGMTTGFSDVYYFSRTFKKITGRNPSVLSRS